MKKPYEEPKLRWQPIRSNCAVADVCWGHAASGKPFYYNTYGTGYVELIVTGKCKKGLSQPRLEFYPSTMSEEDRQLAEAEALEVWNQALAMAGNKPEPFTNSFFSSNPDPNWS